MMTFQQFQESAKWSDDLAQAVGSECWGDDATTPIGFLYLGQLYIEQIQDHWPETARQSGDWYLILGRAEYISRDIVELERLLYAWAISEGYGVADGTTKARTYFIEPTEGMYAVHVLDGPGAGACVSVHNTETEASAAVDRYKDGDRRRAA